MLWHAREVSLSKIGCPEETEQNCFILVFLSLNIAVLCYTSVKKKACPSSSPIAKGDLGPAHLAGSGRNRLDNPDPWELLVVLGCCAALCPGAASESGRDLLMQHKQRKKLGSGGGSNIFCSGGQSKKALCCNANPSSRETLK